MTARRIPPDAQVVAHDIVDHARITYRQLDHWTRQGWLIATDGGTRGVARHWSLAEFAIAVRMGQLVEVGMSAHVAAIAARGGVWR